MPSPFPVIPALEQITGHPIPLVTPSGEFQRDIIQSRRVLALPDDRQGVGDFYFLVPETHLAAITGSPLANLWVTDGGRLRPGPGARPLRDGWQNHLLLLRGGSLYALPQIAPSGEAGMGTGAVTYRGMTNLETGLFALSLASATAEQKDSGMLDLTVTTPEEGRYQSYLRPVDAESVESQLMHALLQHETIQTAFDPKDAGQYRWWRVKDTYWSQPGRNGTIFFGFPWQADLGKIPTHCPVGFYSHGYGYPHSRFRLEPVALSFKYAPHPGDPRKLIVIVHYDVDSHKGNPASIRLQFEVDALTGISSPTLDGDSNQEIRLMPADEITPLLG